MDQETPNASELTTEFLGGLWFCIGLSIPILIFSTDIQNLLEYELELPARDYLLLLWSTVLYAYGSWLFGIGLAVDLKNRKLYWQIVWRVISISGYCILVVYVLLLGVELFWLIAIFFDLLLLYNYLKMKVRQD
ncbi:hypothetical protein [Spirosoma aerophilum]